MASYLEGFSKLQVPRASSVKTIASGNHSILDSYIKASKAVSSFISGTVWYTYLDTAHGWKLQNEYLIHEKVFIEQILAKAQKI